MVNKVTLIGRLGKDPAVKRFSESNAIAEFSLATTERYKDKEGKWVEVTDWHNVKLPFKWMADNAEKFLHKGSLIYIDGKLKTRSYDDKDGNRKYITEVVCDNFKMLDKREGGSGQETSEPVYQPASATSNEYSGNNTSSKFVGEDDLPF